MLGHKESKQAMGTDFLESEVGGTDKEMERKTSKRGALTD
jgi:hypothetical protein